MAVIITLNVHLFSSFEKIYDETTSPTELLYFDIVL